jgi:formimidoylglutamate deiminase
VTTLVPDAVLDGDGVRRGLAVRVADGQIAAVGPAAEAGPGAVRLAGTLLTPGFANVHSHAFQRDLRGLVERRSPAGRDDFWSWRTPMYAHASSLDPATIGDVSGRAFAQMRRAGYTVVGEFHYVHHQPDGTPYPRPNALAEAVCAAAERVGLRIVLLLTAYARGGWNRPPEPGQRRFCDASVEAYLERLEALRSWSADRPLVTVGAAPHSVRAVPRSWLERIAAHCREHDLPLHVHADEQPREVEESLAEHGLRPVELLAAVGALGPRTVVVHGTHVDEAEIRLLAEAQATVCACPTTEANLGDGYVPAERLVAAGVRLSVGSDSNTRIDPLEELRELEACARRTALRRNVLVGPDDAGPGPLLLRAGWADGARALGLPSRASPSARPPTWWRSTCTATSSQAWRTRTCPGARHGRIGRVGSGQLDRRLGDRSTAASSASAP